MVDSVSPNYKYQIGKSHLIGSSILLFMVIICVSKADDNFTWEIKNKASQYGEDLRLSCQVDNCCTRSVGWVKWKSKDEFDTIFIDVKDLGDAESLKYGGGTDKTSFFLIIRNITKDDFNISYSCTYGFLFSKGKVLLEKDAFFDMPTTSVTDKISKGTTETIPAINSKLGLYLKIILPATFAVLVVGIIIVYCKRRSRNKYKAQEGLMRYAQYRHENDQKKNLMLPMADYQLSQKENGLNGETDLELVRARKQKSNSLKSMQSYVSCKST